MHQSGQHCPADISMYAAVGYTSGKSYMGDFILVAVMPLKLWFITSLFCSDGSSCPTNWQCTDGFIKSGYGYDGAVCTEPASCSSYDHSSQTTVAGYAIQTTFRMIDHA